MGETPYQCAIHQWRKKCWNGRVMTKDRDSTTVKVSLINSYWSVETNQSPNESNGMLEKEIYKRLFTMAGEWPGSHSFLQYWNSKWIRIMEMVMDNNQMAPQERPNEKNHPLTN